MVENKVILDVTREIGFKLVGYLEPFCGMLGYIDICMIKKLDFKAGDINKSVIMELQKGWIPPNKCSNKHFLELRGNWSCLFFQGYIFYYL